MNRIYHLVKHWALQGWEWMEDGYMQVTYMATIISELLVLHKIDENNVFLYSAFFFVHLIFLYVLGYLRYCWEKTRKEKVVKIMFYILNAGIVIVALNVIGIVKTMTILTIPFFVTIIHTMLADQIVYLDEWKEVKIIKCLNSIVVKFPKLRYLLWLFLPIVMVLIPLIFLEWNVYLRVAIFVFYVFSIPFISRAADSGMDMIEMVVYSD